MKINFKNPKTALGAIFLISIISIVIDIPEISLKFSNKNIKIDSKIGGYNINLFGGKIFRDLSLRKGLDIKGGVRVLLEADMGGISSNERQSSLESARSVVERRINSLGVSEPNILTLKTGDSFRLAVEIPGIYDSSKAVLELEQVAYLEFKELKDISLEQINESTEPAILQDFFSTDLTGKDLKRASAGFDQQAGGAPIVLLEFTSDGARKFENITERNIQKPLAIFLDGQILSAPIVNQKIIGGSAQITGQFTVEEVNQLVRLLNAGSLPIPLQVVSQENVSASLGSDSIQKSVTAGFIGLGFVVIFMILIYGRLGVLANLALLVYGLVTLALYKFIPVVITLPGLAGFILSIGMAVDANILIFERIKEELRDGKPRNIALELGFGRAWDSIRDANIATLITSFILFNPFNWNFLHTSGPIRGFALTLGLGIFISLFTGIIVTRNLVRVFFKKTNS